MSSDKCSFRTTENCFFKGMLVVCFWTMIELSLSTGYPRAVHARAVHALYTAHALSVCMSRFSVFFVSV